jgi:tripartite-type tricarboxylate transporter receptor subunit TctC
MTTQAQTSGAFPDKPIRLVVPYPPGGTTDLIMRMLQKPLEAASGQPFVVENRPGGGSVIGTGSVAKASPDGYTLLGTDLAIIVNPGLMSSLPYDTVKDFRGVSMLVSSPLVLLAHPSLQANNVQELIALAKKKPGSLNIGSGGYGTSTHMSGEVFKRAADIDIVHVPFQGVAPAMTALVGGQVDLYFGGTSTALPYLQSGKLKAIAVTGEKRNPLLPDVPTFKEAGIPGVNTDTYWGIYAPSGTPNDRAQALNAYFTKALKDPEVVKRMGELGLVQIGNSPDAHTTQMREMISKWTDDIRQAGIKTN